MLSELVNILTRFGCRQIPTPQNLRTLVEQAARCEFCIKPAAALVLVHSGIPNTHKDFWQSRSASDVRALYYGFSVSTTKVLSMLDISPPGNDHEARVAGYLKLMVGNMQVHELSIFLRFVTGSSVCTVPTISVEFNALCGLGRRIWFQVECEVDYAPPDSFHSMECPVFSSKLLELPVENPHDSKITLMVSHFVFVFIMFVLAFRSYLKVITYLDPRNYS